MARERERERERERVKEAVLSAHFADNDRDDHMTVKYCCGIIPISILNGLFQ